MVFRRYITLLYIFSTILALGGCSSSSRLTEGYVGNSLDAGSIVFNETWLVDRWRNQGHARAWIDYRGSKPDQLLRPKNSVAPPDFDDPRGVLDFVLSLAPRHANVFPTERYYYFRAGLLDGEISGNLRFTDIHNGVLHIGYFDPLDPRNSKSRSFSSDDGVFVTFDGSQRVTVQSSSGPTVNFTLAQFNDTDNNLVLLEDETVISGVLDESGIPLTLLYNEKQKCFYYILRNQLPIADKLVQTELPGVLIGWNSRFVFYKDDLDRYVLVGIHAEHVRRNSYYDGPFDQVPPHLPLREKLEAAYPYVTYRGGIDEHGRFINVAGSRVAITPYRLYRNRHELLRWVKATVDRHEPQGMSVLLSKLTYETKKDFHKRIGKGGMPSWSDSHLQWMSQGWPANHHGSQSINWPHDHLMNRSFRWLDDHDVEQSRKK